MFIIFLYWYQIYNALSIYSTIFITVCYQVSLTNNVDEWCFKKKELVIPYLYRNICNVIRVISFDDWTHNTFTGEVEIRSILRLNRQEQVLFMFSRNIFFNNLYIYIMAIIVRVTNIITLSTFRWITCDVSNQLFPKVPDPTCSIIKMAKEQI